MGGYHIRKQYEQLYCNLINDKSVSLKNKSIIYVGSMSDYQLLDCINNILIENNCIPFNEEELEMELH